jgi:hypothetical protein
MAVLTQPSNETAPAFLASKSKISGKFFADRQKAPKA